MSLLLAFAAVILILVIYYIYTQQTATTAPPPPPSTSIPLIGGQTPKGVQYIYEPYVICTAATQVSQIKATNNPGNDLDAMGINGNGLFQVGAASPVIGNMYTVCAAAQVLKAAAPGAVGAFLLAIQNPNVTTGGIAYTVATSATCLDIGAQIPLATDISSAIDNAAINAIGVFGSGTTWYNCNKYATIGTDTVYATGMPVTTTNGGTEFTFTPFTGCDAIGNEITTATDFGAAIDTCTTGEYDTNILGGLPCLGIVGNGAAPFYPCYSLAPGGGAGIITISSPATQSPTPKKTPYAYMPNTSCSTWVGYNQYDASLTWQEAADTCAADKNVSGSGYPCVGIAKVTNGGLNVAPLITPNIPWTACTAVGTPLLQPFNVDALAIDGAIVNNSLVMKTPAGNKYMYFPSGNYCNLGLVPGSNFSQFALPFNQSLNTVSCTGTPCDPTSEQCQVDMNCTFALTGGTFANEFAAIDACTKQNCAGIVNITNNYDGIWNGSSLVLQPTNSGAPGPTWAMCDSIGALAANSIALDRSLASFAV